MSLVVNLDVELFFIERVLKNWAVDCKNHDSKSTPPIFHCFIPN